MPRNERGQFTRNDIYIPLPSLSGLYKILVIGILIFPWYTILKNKDYSTTLFSSMLGTEYCPICPVCSTCSECPVCPECITLHHQNAQHHHNAFANAQLTNHLNPILILKN